MEQLKKLFEDAKEKLFENKELVIRVGCAVGGALVGAVITGAILNAQADAYLMEELTTAIEDVATE